MASLTQIPVATSVCKAMPCIVMLLSSEKLGGEEMSRTCLTFLNLLTLKHTLCRLPWPGALLQCSADSLISCICSFRHSPFWTTIEPPCLGHANHLQDSFSSILMYFFHVKKLQSEDNYGACFKGFLTSLRWIKKKVSQ